MNILFLDIETIPAEAQKHEILKAIHDQKVQEGKTTKTFEEVLEASGLNGAFGQICCISYAINDNPVQILCEEESQMVRSFWDIAKDIDLFVGFNIFDFDLRFIWQRSVILKIKPSRDIPFIRHTSSPIYDCMYEWCRWSGGVGSRIGLSALSQALGIPSPKNGDVVGRTVAKAYAEGKIKEICDYCSRDVESTRSIYYRLTFIQ